MSDKSGRTVDSGKNECRMGHDTRLFIPTHNVRCRQRISERVVVSNSTTDRLTQAALSSGKGEPRFLHAFVPIRGGGFTSVCR